MDLKYDIEIFPADSRDYRLAAYVEGTLSVVVMKKALFEVTGVLLVELATSLSYWLRRTSEAAPVDWEYESMDFEEKPILAFHRLADAGRFRVSSVFSDATADISVAEVIESAKAFVTRLEHDLKSQHGVDLRRVIDAALADDQYKK